MELWQAIGQQLAHPRGWAGRAAGHAMRLVNHAPYARAIDALNLNPRDRVLDLGCGPGHGVRLVANQVRDGIVYGVDQSAAMLDQARARNRQAVKAHRVRLYRACFDALPLPEQSVDKVLAVNVAYFWRDGDAVLRELRRVLRPGGRLVVYVTHEATMRQWRFAEPETHRLFDHDGLRRLLQAGISQGESLTITELPLPFGIRGLIAALCKSAAAPQNPTTLDISRFAL